MGRSPVLHRANAAAPRLSLDRVLTALQFCTSLLLLHLAQVDSGAVFQRCSTDDDTGLAEVVRLAMNTDVLRGWRLVGGLAEISIRAWSVVRESSFSGCVSSVSLCQIPCALGDLVPFQTCHAYWRLCWGRASRVG